MQELTPARAREVRKRLLATGTVVAAGDGRVHELFPIAIGAEEGRELSDWVRSEEASWTLETGLGYAVATLFICEGLLATRRDGHHVAIDPYQLTGLPGQRTKFEGVGLEILEEAGVRDLVEFYAEESQIVLPRLLGEGREFDLAFLDGNHRFEGVFLDLVYSGRLLKEHGIVFVDDTQLPAVRRAVTFCIRNLGWEIEAEGQEGPNHEWLVLRTGLKEAFLRPYSDFTDF
jgi:predicted O-methyltransferase YrrM